MIVDFAPLVHESPNNKSPMMKTPRDNKNSIEASVPTRERSVGW